MTIRVSERLLYICIWFVDASDRRTSHADAIQAVHSRPPREDTRRARLRYARLMTQADKRAFITPSPRPVFFRARVPLRTAPQLQNFSNLLASNGVSYPDTSIPS
ncbi:hypothetical protein AOLI_G00254150 [Acnodon oligacanthus]